MFLTELFHQEWHITIWTFNLKKKEILRLARMFWCEFFCNNWHSIVDWILLATKQKRVNVMTIAKILAVTYWIWIFVRWCIFGIENVTWWLDRFIYHERSSERNNSTPKLVSKLWKLACNRWPTISNKARITSFHAITCWIQVQSQQRSMRREKQLTNYFTSRGTSRDNFGGSMIYPAKMMVIASYEAVNFFMKVIATSKWFTKNYHLNQTDCFWQNFSLEWHRLIWYGQVKVYLVTQGGL